MKQLKLKNGWSQCTKVMLTPDEFVSEWINLFGFPPEGEFIPTEPVKILRFNIEFTLTEYVRNRYILWLNTFMDKYNLMDLTRGIDILRSCITKKRQVKRKPA